jgi:hypothetical protein
MIFATLNNLNPKTKLMNKVNVSVGHAFLSIAVVLSLSFSVLISSCKDKKDSAAPAPSITSLAPESGLPGVEVTITGKNYNTDKTKNIVKFGSTQATVSAATATALTVQAPGTLTVGAVKVTVSTTDGNSNEASFTVLAAIVPPQITSFAPDSVSKGQALTITGANLNDVDSVVINGVKQTIGTKNATTITLNILPKTFSGKLALYKGGTATYHTKNVGYKETYTVAATHFSSYGKAKAISIDKNGYVYLATDKSILKLNASGAFMDTLIKQPNDTTFFLDVLARANGDMLVSTGTGTGSICGISKINGKQLVPLYTVNSFAIIYLTEMPNGDVYFAKTGNMTGDDIYKLNTSGSSGVFVTMSNAGLDKITSDTQGNVYISNVTDNKIVRYTPPSNVATDFAIYPGVLGSGGLNYSSKTGIIYWIDSKMNSTKLYKYKDASHYTEIPTNENTSPATDLAFTSSGDIIICLYNYLIKIVVD